MLLDPIIFNAVLVFFVLLIFSAFFSSCETAFTAISRIQLRHLVDKKVKGAEKVDKLLEQPKRLITAVLIGNTLANIAATAIATAVLLQLFTAMGIHLLVIKMCLVTAIVTFVMLLIGEVTPKAIAIIYSERVALMFVYLLELYMFIFKPVIWLFEEITNRIHQMLGVQKHIQRHHLSKEEFRVIVTMGEEAGIIEKKESQMIKRIFEFSNTIVREIMTPRTDAVLMDIETPIEDVIHRFIEIGHSRIPVYDGKPENIIGIIHAKELLSIPKDQPKLNLKNYMREAIFIPETLNIEQLLQQMKKNKFHMAIVADEYGGVSGLVTLEDIIEEIVGEIQDEFDIFETPQYTKIHDNHYIVDGKTNISDLPDEFRDDFMDNDDYDTIGGFILYQLGRFPQRNESVPLGSLVILVKEISKRRILKVEIKRSQEDPAK